MCGIIGYIGDNVEQNLIAGLENLNIGVMIQQAW